MSIEETRELFYWFLSIASIAVAAYIFAIYKAWQTIKKYDSRKQNRKS